VRFPRNADYPYLANISAGEFSYLTPEKFASFAGSLNEYSGFTKGGEKEYNVVVKMIAEGSHI